MKQIYLSAIILTLCACQSNIEKNADLDLNNMNYGWLDTYDSVNHHISINSPWGARGWIYGVETDTTTYFDASEYDNVVVDLKNISGSFSHINIIVRYVDSENDSRNLSTIVDGATTIRVDLEPNYKSKVKSIFLMTDSLCEMDITKACYGKNYHYGPAKELAMSDIGIISSDQFEGYSDNARIEMTFMTEGDIMGIDQYGNNVDMTGWTVGIICSAADILGAELPTRGINLRNIGIQKFTCLLGEVRYLLSHADEDGECGIYWTVWKIGGMTNAKVLGTTIAEVADKEIKR